MITNLRKQETADTLRTLSQKHKDLHADYSQETHTITAFMVVSGIPMFNDWMRKTTPIRRALTMTKATVIDAWVADPSAPCLKDRPWTAIIWDESVDAFRPGINLGCVTKGRLSMSLTTAVEQASRATVFKLRYGRLPTTADLPDIERIIIPGPAGADLDPAVADLLSRINGRGDTPGPSAESAPGTSQNGILTNSGQQTKQAHNSNRYQLSYKGKHPL